MRVTAIVVREWQEYLIRGRWFFFGLLLPGMVILPILLGGSDLRVPAHLMDEMAKVQAVNIAGITPVNFLRINQGLLFLLITPISLSLQFAVQGLMAEKQSGSLEPLLAAPVRIWELLLGKAIAAVVPGVLTTWIGWLMAILAIFVQIPEALPMVFLPSYLVQFLLVTPLITITGALIGLTIASRIGESRVAQQIAGYVQLPFLLGVVVLSNARVAINLSTWLLTAGALLVLALVALQFAIRLFNREAILVRGR